MIFRMPVLSIARSCCSKRPNTLTANRCSIVENTGLIAEGLSNPAARQPLTASSPKPNLGLFRLVTAISTTSARARLYAALLTTTAGRCFELR